MSPIRINRRTGVKMSNRIAVFVIVLMVVEAAFLLYIYAWKDNQLERLRRDLDKRDEQIEKLEEENESLREKVRIRDIIEDLNSSLDRDEQALIARVVHEQSEFYVCSPELILALIMTESSFRPDVRSKQDARGLMQLLPWVGRGISDELADLLSEEEQDHLGLRYRDDDSLFDPETNIRLGMFYFAQLLDRFDGDLKHAIRAYNAGPTRLERRLREGESVPDAYLRKVMANYQMLREKYGNPNVPSQRETSLAWPTPMRKCCAWSAPSWNRRTT